MKKALIIFAILFIMTLLIPMLSLTGIGAKKEKKSTDNQLVTIFESRTNISCAENYHLFLSDEP